MPLSLYSARKDGNGASVHFTLNSKDKCVFAHFIKQVSWTNNKGVFKGGKQCKIKLGDSEIGGIIYAVQRNKIQPIYHKFEGNESRGNFKYYEIPPKSKDDVKKEGFTFDIEKDGTQYRIGLNMGSAFRIMEYMKNAAARIDSADYAKDKKDYEKRLKEKEESETDLKVPEIEQEPDESVVDNSDVDF